MKKYIVKGTDLSSLLLKVAKHFNVNVNEIKYEVLRKTPELEVKVWMETNEKEEEKENPFYIEIKNDGIFLTVKENEGAKNVMLKKILNYVEENKIKDIDIDAVEEAIHKINEAVKISEFDKDYYIDSEATIEILNNMEATLKITKPNKGRELNLERILELATEKGINYGLRKKAIQTVLDEKIYDRKFILAKGKEVKNGVDAYINYTFKNTKESTSDSEKNESVKSIDFKELNLFQNVSKDEILAQKIPMQFGEDGIDIYGNPVLAKEPKDIQLTAGKNTYITEDGLHLKSEIDGQLVQKGKNLSVEPVLVIPGNVDYATGNVDFLGSVIVKGNVISGFSIKAGEDIFVEGLVEDCSLIANGSITVNNGILGNEEFLHTIYAKAGLKAQFIQHMRIKTDGTVEVSKHILHSIVEAGDKVIVTSGTGKIIGGEVKAQRGIECNIAGGPFETPTKLTLDVYSEVVKEETELNKEMLVLEENKFKVEKLLKDVEPFKENLNDDMKQKIDEALKQLAAINNRYVQLQEERNFIEEQRHTIKEHQIKVLNKVYAGVVVKIGRELYLNRSEKIKTDFLIDRETNELVER